MKTVGYADEKSTEAKKTVVEEVAPAEESNSSYSYKKVPHPFRCRLNDKAAFTVTAPNALIAAGFASMGMGLFTLFRPTPVLLFFLSHHLKRRNSELSHCNDLVLATALSWDAVMMFVLIVLGFVLTFSVKIKKRKVLLLHPWGLMVLYLDAFVWLSLTSVLHQYIIQQGPITDESLQIQYPLVYFIVIYIENILFGLLHYIYATYFIAAELSVIERCF